MTQVQAPTITPENLHMQIEGFANFDRTLTPGKSAKAAMADLKAGSSDLWKVKPQDITVLPGFNPRVQNRAFFEGIQVLAENMVAHGYMQDKPLAVYSAKIDGEDKLVLQDGHRRLAAVLRAIEMGAPIKVVPVVLKERTESMIDLTLALLHSNEGQPFSTFEKAILAKRLKKYGWENKQIAAEFRCTAAFVGQLLLMASAPQAIADLVQQGNLSATEAHRLMMTHGAEEAGRMATEGAAAAKAAGRTKITAKDLTPSDLKAKNAKKYAFELYKAVKKMREDPAIEKLLEDKQIDAVDAMLAAIEKKPRVKAEPKPPKAPKAVKTVKAPKAVKAVKAVPLAKKIADGAQKGKEIKTKGSDGFFEVLNKQEAERKGVKASATRTVARQRRSDR